MIEFKIYKILGRFHVQNGDSSKHAKIIVLKYLINKTRFTIHISEMFGYVGGSKANREYPTVAKVMAAFYEMHPGTRMADLTEGEIPLVSSNTFRY